MRPVRRCGRCGSSGRGLVERDRDAGLAQEGRHRLALGRRGDLARHLDEARRNRRGRLGDEDPLLLHLREHRGDERLCPLLLGVGDRGDERLDYGPARRGVIGDARAVGRAEVALALAEARARPPEVVNAHAVHANRDRHGAEVVAVLGACEVGDVREQLPKLRRRLLLPRARDVADGHHARRHPRHRVGVGAAEVIDAGHLRGRRRRELRRRRGRRDLLALPRREEQRDPVAHERADEARHAAGDGRDGDRVQAEVIVLRVDAGEVEDLLALGARKVHAVEHLDVAEPVPHRALERRHLRGTEDAAELLGVDAVDAGHLRALLQELRLDHRPGRVARAPAEDGREDDLPEDGHRRRGHAKVIARAPVDESADVRRRRQRRVLGRRVDLHTRR